jgi:hypothetical protein
VGALNVLLSKSNLAVMPEVPDLAGDTACGN